MTYIDQLLKEVNGGKMTKQEFCQRLTKKFKGQSVWEFQGMCEESEDFSFQRLTPSDSNEDVKDLLYRFTTTHTYDNGLPLTGLNYPPENPTQEHYYFEHYDRDDDFESTGMDEEILEVWYDEESDDVNVRVDVTKEDFENNWTESYDKSSYEHDFGPTVK